MNHFRTKSATITALLIVCGGAAANLFPQGARPIDGELGISAEGKITGILHANSESSTGQRISLAIAIGTYASEAEEDAAIARGTNGSKNFRIVTSSSSAATVDLSAPWAPGVELPLCDNATLIVKTQNIYTNAFTITRNRLLKGQFMVIQSKVQPPDAQKNQPKPTFATERPAYRTKSRSLPIDGVATMTSAGLLSGSLKSTNSAAKIFVAFSPGSGQSFFEALDRISNQTPGYIPFTEVTETTQLGALEREITTPDLPTQTKGGMVVIKVYFDGDPIHSYTYLPVVAGDKSKPIPKGGSIDLPATPTVTRFGSRGDRDMQSRSLPIDGAVDLASASGIVTGTMTIRPPAGIRSGNPMLEVASVGIEPSNGTSVASVLEQLRRSDSTLTKAFKAIDFNVAYKIVASNPVAGQLQFKRGQKVAVLFRLGGPLSSEYYLSLISGSGKPPHGKP